MHTLHLLPSFQSLQYLKLTGILGDSNVRKDLQFPIGFESPTKTLTPALQNKEAIRLERKQEYRRDGEILANALNCLSNLRKLDFHMCSIIDGEWLQLLPKNLTHLGILECDRIDSDDLRDFLESHGTHLKVLVLNHNAALNISFLTTLRSSCPVLEEFSMDMTYYRKLATIDGTDGPEYESLLLEDERPTWPKTLQSIEMNHLRHWSSSAADLFFRSLIESAKDLPDLRSLELTVSLDISWRERAKMRDQWEEKFKRVFCRREVPPNPAWWSMHSFRQWQERQNVRVVVPVLPPSVDPPQETSGDDDAVSNTRRHGKRAAPSVEPVRRLRARKTGSETDTATGISGSLRDMVMQTMETHIQGMCDNVDVRIDNLRPREQQFEEGDFLDSEPSGDEEWNEGRGDLDDEELYVRKKGKGRGKYAW